MDGCQHLHFLKCMQGWWTLFSVSSLFLPPLPSCCTRASFRIRKIFPFIHCRKHSAIFSIIPGPTVSTDNLSFSATGKLDGLRKSSLVRSMSSQATCFHSRCYSSFFPIKVPFPPYFPPHLHATTQLSYFSIREGHLLARPLYVIPLTSSKAGIPAQFHMILRSQLTLTSVPSLKEIALFRLLVCKCLFIACSTCTVFFILVCQPLWLYGNTVSRGIDCTSFSSLLNQFFEIHAFISLTRLVLSIKNLKSRMNVVSYFVPTLWYVRKPWFMRFTSATTYQSASTITISARLGATV